MTKKKTELKPTEWRNIAVNSGIVTLGIAGAIVNPAVTGAALIAGAAAGFCKQKKSFSTKVEQAFKSMRLGAPKDGKQPRSQDDVNWPRLIRHAERDYGHSLIYRIPVDMSIKNFWAKEMELESALQAEIEMWEQDGYLHMRAFTNRLPRYVSFQWPPDEKSQPPQDMIIPFIAGISRAGIEWADLAALPHLLIGGETGAGKSAFLHQFLFTLCHYDWIRITIVDLKKLEFVEYQDHALYVHDISQALNSIAMLRTEMFRRMNLLQSARKNNIRKWQGEKLPFHVLIVDEFAQLWPQPKAEHPEVTNMKKAAHSMLHDIISLARAVGIHCVISTQRPDKDILPGQLKANIPGTVAFRCRNTTNAGILDIPEAAFIPREIKGRAYWMFDVLREVQIPYLEPSRISRELPSPVTRPAVKTETVLSPGAV